MIIIKCGKCRQKVIKYKKIGAGKVLRCFKERITHYYQQPLQEGLVCSCGELIGSDAGKWYNMKNGKFIYTGRVDK